LSDKHTINKNCRSRVSMICDYAAVSRRTIRWRFNIGRYSDCNVLQLSIHFILVVCSTWTDRPRAGRTDHIITIWAYVIYARREVTGGTLMFDIYMLKHGCIRNGPRKKLATL